MLTEQPRIEDKGQSFTLGVSRGDHSPSLYISSVVRNGIQGGFSGTA
jgi:hypothetical protein